MALPNFPIISAATGVNGTFTIAGNYTSLFAPADQISEATKFTITSSPANNGTYVVESSVYASGNTVISVIEPVSSALAGGVITYVSVYQIDFTSSTKPPIFIRPNTVNKSTTIDLPGRFTSNWGEYLLEAFVRMLENFSSSIPPANPTLGQKWFNSSNDVLSVYTSVGWRELSYTAPTYVGNQVRGYAHTQSIASDIWTIQHNLGTTDITFSIFQANGDLMMPYSIEKNAVSITVYFSTPQTGKIVITGII